MQDRQFLCLFNLSKKPKSSSSHFVPQRTSGNKEHGQLATPPIEINLPIASHLQAKDHPVRYQLEILSSSLEIVFIMRYRH